VVHATTAAVRRLAGNPIISRATNATIGVNINGPSLIAAPPWLKDPLGRYYLYFAHHRGTYIRLATADRLEGPWTVYEPGTLHLDQSLFPAEGRRPHIASPDVHVDTASGVIRMYYHGLQTDTREQYTRVATSSDGISFEARPELLGRPYFRAFEYGGWWYALGMPGILYRSADGLGGFERGPRLFERSMRHTALLLRGDELLVFWSRVGDRPERILCSRIALGRDWRQWREGPPITVLAPEQPWEGADLCVDPSERGWADEPVHQLRDPAIYEEDGRAYLLYSTAGESGIAIAELESVEALMQRAREATSDETDQEQDQVPDTDAGAAAKAEAEPKQPSKFRGRMWTSTERILNYVNRTHGTGYGLAERLAGGRQSGTYLIHDPKSGNAVLKWSTRTSRADQVLRAAPVVEAARAAGWPTPAWLAVGTTPSGFPYHVREYAEGEPGELVTADLVHAVLPVLDNQAGLRPATDQNWSDYDHRAVFEDESGFAGQIAATADGKRLVGLLEAWTAPFQKVELPADDLVHGDLGPENVLLRQGRLSALIDVESVGRGSRFHDVATLIVAANLWGGDPAASRDLHDYAARHAAPGEFEVSVAACLLATLAFQIENGREDVSTLIRAAIALVGELGAA
jgi:aminoglycoside phosphotransferase (APT) family kinase protein